MHTAVFKTDDILARIGEQTKLGDLRKIAKEIKKDPVLASELWKSGHFLARMLSILITDVKKLDETDIDDLFRDMAAHPSQEQSQLADWLMANQLVKDKRTIAMMKSWQNDDMPLKRRLFWYYEGRLRWMGQTPPENNAALLDAIEAEISSEAPQVQWAMNFTAGWIGIFDLEHRSRCVEMGEKIGLYKDDFVHKNCTPNYLPEFIDIEARKRGL